jgi:hypothetical protein
MPRYPVKTIEVEGETIDLRSPFLAAFLAWLWPGAGHLYQRRYFKGWLMMVCILTTFFFGFAIGGARVVYASMAPNDFRWHYFLQAGVGLPAMPAMLELARIKRFENQRGETRGDYKPLLGGLMAPPVRPILINDADQLADWHLETGAGFELGSWYTIIAGLLNVFAIFDAYGGPLNIAISGKRTKSKTDDDAGKASGDRGIATGKAK